MIRFEQVTHDYGGGAVFRDLEVEVAAGSLTVVCGPNAVGKTTLLRLAAGLLVPTRGRVWLADRPLAEWSLRALSGRRAFMSQRFECATGFTVAHVLELAIPTGSRDGVSRDGGTRASVVEALELGPLLRRSVGSLSTGQAQRVAFARLLLQCPADGVLLLDEPFAALDPRWSLVFARMLRERVGQGGTVLVSIHDLGLAGGLAEDVLLLSGEGLAAHGPAAEVLRPEVLESAYHVGFELLQTRTGRSIPVTEGP